VSPKGKSVRFIRRPQWFCHALGLYGRLTAAERLVLDTVEHYSWGFGTRESVAVGYAVFQARAPGVCRESIRRAVTSLRTPASEKVEFQKGRPRQGHGLLLLVKAASATTEAQYAIEQDWERWGWPPGADLAPIAAILKQYGDPDKPVYTPDAENMAGHLRAHVLNMVGELAAVPPAQPQSRAWVRWCMGMQGLLVRGYHPNVVARVLVPVSEDAHWAPRITGQYADKKLINNLDDLLVRTRMRDNQRGRL